MLVKLIVSRMTQALLTLLAVSVVIFCASQFLPGDVAVRVLGRESTPAQRALFRQEMHLDEPPVQRYAQWLAGAVRGDFGRSIASQEDVTSIVAPPLQNTLLLSAYAFLLYVPLSMLLAMIGAVYRGRPPDVGISLLTLIGLAMPEFVLGTILLIVFAVIVPIFPAMSLLAHVQGPLDFLRATALPALTLTVVMAVYAIRMLRDNLIEVLGSDYVRMATLKGLPRYRVLLQHAVPNALGPALNVTALNLAYLVGGVVIVENVFAFPGLGNLLVNSVSLRDMPVVEAVTLIISAIYIFANLIADVATMVLNPRLRSH